MQTVSIVERLSLANKFVQVTFDDPLFYSVQPGQFVQTEQGVSCYLMGLSNGKACALVEPSQAYHFQNDHICVTTLQGEPFPAPCFEEFMLLTAPILKLYSILFYCKIYRKSFKGLVLIETNDYFPFHPCPSKIFIQHIPNNVIGAIALLEDWDIPSRLCTLQDKPGCFQGTADELARLWISQSNFNCAVSQAKIPPIKLYTCV